MAAVDARQTRTIDTQNRLMRAMENLSAKKGAENVTVRELIKEAGQKNESVLQYHFKSKEGLLTAIHKSKYMETQAKRLEMLTDCLARNTSPTFRDICYLIVAPTFQLCKSDARHRQWVRAFGAKNIIVKRPLLEEEVIDEGNSLRVIRKLLKQRLTHLDDSMFEYRYLNVVRFSILSMSNQAHEKGAFNGKNADFFLSSLVDSLVGLFMAEVSSETRALLGKI